MKNLIFTLAISLCTLALSAQKFGFINSQELIQGIPEVKEANANIETYQKQFAKKGEDMITALRSKYQELEQKQATGAISPMQLETEAQELKKEEIKIAQFEQESIQNINQKSETLLQPIRQKIQDAIDAVAKENGLVYIFDYSLGVIIYADESSDVSAQVKAKLGI